MFVKTLQDEFYGLADMVWVRSTQVDMHFVCSLEWHMFGLHMRFIILLAGMGWVSSTHVEILFEFSLPRDVFDHHVLRCILCITWHRIYMIKTS